MTSCDVIKLASKLEQGKAMHGRAALLTLLARAMSCVCSCVCVEREQELWARLGCGLGMALLEQLAPLKAQGSCRRHGLPYK